MNENAQNWQEYWRKESPQGEVFVNSEGAKHPALTAFWDDLVAAVADDQRVLDVASGAGSVLAVLARNSTLTLEACDLSAQGLALLTERIPAVRTTVCDAATLPYADCTMDWVVSQFGIEYAGVAAFAEAARVLAPGGQFVALCHYRDGQIDQSHQRQLAAAVALRDNAFIDHAITLTERTFGNNPAAQQSAVQAFVPAERALAAAVKAEPTGVHAHLYGGFRTLYENRRQYDARDITQWLDQMRDEVDKSILRLEAITAVALDVTQIEQIADLMTGCGLEWQAPEPFFGNHPKLPVAWTFRARRN